jgi:tetraacyldisaccharide 4'-kinase
VDAHVISFGNVTTGGTGKTPAVIERARKEIAAGHKVAVLTRGYGADRSGARMVVVEGREAAGMWRAVGDEAALIAHKVPDVIIGKCADRRMSARAAIERHACDMLILDDGFQYVRIERDENIAVIDATNPFGNGRLIPRGILREPVSALSRATHILLTRCDMAPDRAALVRELQRICPDTPIRQTRHKPTGLWRLCDGEGVGLELLRDVEVAAVCAIGNPDAFLSTLRSLGAVVKDAAVYRDHSLIPPDALARDRLVITTDKDAVHMESPPGNVYALSIELEDVEDN